MMREREKKEKTQRVADIRITDGPSQSNAKSWLSLVYVMPLIPLFL
jgi:hypothetical protein